MDALMRDLGTSEKHRKQVLGLISELVISEPTLIVPLLKINILSNLLLSVL